MSVQELCWNKLARDSREIEVSDNKEEERAAYKDIVVVFSYLCGIGDQQIHPDTSDATIAGAIREEFRKNERRIERPSAIIIFGLRLTWENALGPASVMPTLTIKCDAAANPMTRLRSAIGRTSAPIVHNVSSSFYDQNSVADHKAMLCCSACHL